MFTMKIKILWMKRTPMPMIIITTTALPVTADFILVTILPSVIISEILTAILIGGIGEAAIPQFGLTLIITGHIMIRGIILITIHTIMGMGIILQVTIKTEVLRHDYETTAMAEV